MIKLCIFCNKPFEAIGSTKNCGSDACKERRRERRHEIQNEWRHKRPRDPKNRELDLKLKREWFIKWMRDPKNRERCNEMQRKNRIKRIQTKRMLQFLAITTTVKKTTNEHKTSNGNAH